MKRSRRRLALALGAAALAGVVLLGCCCHRAPSAGPAHASPLPAQLVLPVPPPIAAASDTTSQLEMRNVGFHLDDSIVLRIRSMRAEAHDLEGEHVVVLDDKRRILLDIASAEIGLTGPDLSDLLNRYVFGYKGSPLSGLVVRTAGDHIVQSGVMHKGVDIPFTMEATLSVTTAGLIRIHPTSMKICSIPGLGLLDALHLTLEKLLDLKGAKGVFARGNDLLLDPTEILPPPKIEGHLTAIRVEGDEVVQTFGSPDAAGAAPLTVPVVASNYILFRGGTLRFGKLYMVETELETIDEDPSDFFDFYLDYYQTQLVAGYHRTLPDYGLAAWMPDFGDLGKEKGKATPP